MRRLGQLFLVTTTTALLFVGFVTSVSAQADPRNPPMPWQRFARDKETLYALFSQNKMGISPEQQKRAYLAAQDFCAGTEETTTITLKKRKNSSRTSKRKSANSNSTALLRPGIM